MLAIRLQRVGRKGYATYRIAVQEAQRHPSSGRIVAYVGTYNPHTKDAKVQVEIAQKYLDTGAQPSPRVIKLLTTAGVKMPKWVEKATKKSKTIRKAEKLRKNRTNEKVVAVKEVAEEVAEETADVAETTEVVEATETAEAKDTTETA